MNLNPWIALLIGLIVGWVLQWLLDVFYFRRKRTAIEKTIADFQTEASAKENQLTLSRQQVEGQLNAVQADYDQLKLENADLAGKVATLTAGAAAAATTAATLKDRDKQLADVTAQLQARDKDLAASKTQLDALQTELDRLKASAASKDQDLQTAQATRADLESKLKRADDDLSRSRSQIGSLQRELDKAQKDNSGLLDEVATFAAGAVAGVVGGKLRGKDDVKATLAAMKTELDAANASKAKLESTVGDLQKELGGVRGQLAGAQAELGTTKEEGSGNLAKIATLTAGAAATAAAIKAKDDEINGLKTRVTELEGRDADFDKMSAQIDSLQKELDKEKKDHGGKIAEIAALGAAAAATAAAIKSKDNEIDELKVRAAALEKELSDAKTAPAQAMPSEHVRFAASAAAPTAALVGFAAGAGRGKVVAVATSACPQDMEQVSGIGTVFEQRLYAAGVGSFWDLANMTDEEMTHVLGIQEGQVNTVDFDAVRMDAFRLAQRSGSVGRTWSGEEPDDFEPLDGIGPVYERKLYDAGICSFDALANTTVERLAEICDGAGVRKPDYAMWIEQARGLAAKSAVMKMSRRVRKAAETAALARGLGTIAIDCPQDLAEVRGIGSVFEQRLYDAGIGTFWDLAHMSDDDLARVLQIDESSNFSASVDCATIRSQAMQLAEKTKSVGRTWSSGEADDFEPLKGIGPVIERKLYDAGICTYEALANTTVERLTEIYPPTGSRPPDYASWIEQARARERTKTNLRMTQNVQAIARRAARARNLSLAMSECPQDMQAVEGIGTVFEQRLYEAGIGTYWELGHMPDDELARVLQIADDSNFSVDFDAIRASALRVAKETDSEGRMWSGGGADDFEPLEGIGAVFERRLYDAGICTYETLANTTVERLVEICQVTGARTPDFAAWIRQAKALVKKGGR
jgi:predicted flap endonuclease-1-like 5' DNA nuclease